jgi:hypothetical protein
MPVAIHSRGRDLLDDVVRASMDDTSIRGTQRPAFRGRAAIAGGPGAPRRAKEGSAPRSNPALSDSRRQ